MQRLAADHAAFTHALWLEDYETMSLRSASMAGHAAIAPDELQRIRDALGSDMDAFREVDESVHHASERLHAAAEARRLDDIVTRLNEVQRGCVECHTRFRDRLRTDTAQAAAR